MKASAKNILNLGYFVLSTLVVTVILLNGSAWNILKISGTLVIVSSCYLVLWFFLSHFRTEVFGVTRKTLFIILMILSFVTITKILVNSAFSGLFYLIPFVIVPVVIRIFYDARLAQFIFLITLILSGFMVPDPFEFIFINFITGMAAIFTLSNIYRRGKLFFTSMITFVSYSVLYFGLFMMKADTHDFEVNDFIMFAVNSLFVLLSYPIIFLFESKFLFLSETTLLELADTNHPLLRKLSDEAPGSFQHSLQVANLAEEAARTIGANMLLARTGSLYHDIGKIANPSYFIENQADDVNPHEDLDPVESARVIISHVRNGVNLARNYKIPVQIIDFIRTHHGTMVAYYFFKKYTDQNPWDTAREKDFAYTGPRPFSKETAVVMMADAVEASSRSMSSYSENSISEMVERIMYLQEQDGQYSDVPLTFKDISDIKSSFKKRLANIYHTRIAYPERG